MGISKSKLIGLGIVGLAVVGGIGIVIKNSAASDAFEQKVAQEVARLNDQNPQLHIDYTGAECSGAVSTECTISEITATVRGEEAMDINKLIIHNVEKLIQTDSQRLQNGEIPVRLSATGVEPAQADMQKFRGDYHLDGCVTFSHNLPSVITVSSLSMENDFVGVDSHINALDITYKQDGNIQDAVISKVGISLENKNLYQGLYEAYKANFEGSAEEKRKLNYALTGQHSTTMINSADTFKKRVKAHMGKSLTLPPNAGQDAKHILSYVKKFVSEDEKNLFLHITNKNNLAISQIVQGYLRAVMNIKGATPDSFIKANFAYDVGND